MTTRPEINICNTLKDLKPLLLEPNDEENLKDIGLYFERNLSGLFEAENREMVLTDLVEKSEGVFLCAQFLVDFIKTNCSTLTLIRRAGKDSTIGHFVCLRVLLPAP